MSLHPKPHPLPSAPQDDASGLYDLDAEDATWIKLYNSKVRLS